MLHGSGPGAVVVTAPRADGAKHKRSRGPLPAVRVGSVTQEPSLREELLATFLARESLLYRYACGHGRSTYKSLSVGRACRCRDRFSSGWSGTTSLQLIRIGSGHAAGGIEGQEGGRVGGCTRDHLADEGAPGPRMPPPQILPGAGGDCRVRQLAKTVAEHGLHHPHVADEAPPPAGSGPRLGQPPHGWGAFRGDPGR